MRVKILGTAVTLTTTPDIISSSAVNVLLVHDAGGNTGRTITLYENDGTTVVGSLYSNPGSQLVIHKKADQKLKVDAGTDVRVTPVGYIS
ncbi:hypothetical protein EBR43_06440 [bacterium]|nr:hypothetical protein [bacterium]